MFIKSGKKQKHAITRSRGKAAIFENINNSVTIDELLSQLIVHHIGIN
ncbi:MAG: hypothetical protein P8X42_12500 [Calditrichaceae bacterium]